MFCHRSDLKFRLRLWVLVCIAAILLTLSLTSCNKDAEDGLHSTEQPTSSVPELPNNHTLNENGLVDVVVLKENVLAGQKITASFLKTVELPPENLPQNIVSDRTQIVGKYSLKDLYAGDYIALEWLVEDKSMIPNDHLIKQEIECFDDDYIVVTDYMKANTGEDLLLQELIDKNPGRTIYFPDGEYVISKSLMTTSEPSKSTSFYFSSGAVLKAADFCEKSSTYNALISLGSYKKVNNIKTPGSNFFVMGGIFDGNGVADGIALFAGRETLIKDVVILNVKCGISVKQGTNGNSSDTDIDDVTIVGNGDFNSIGIIFGGDDNTVTNARISNVGTGMVVSNTTFVSSCTVENTMGERGTAGFFIGGNCYLSDCVSINYDIGFDINDATRGYAKQCLAIWPSGEGETHIAFRTKRFRFSIFGCRAEFGSGEVENIFLSAEPDGFGWVVSPIFDASLVSEADMTKYYLYENTDIVDIG